MPQENRVLPTGRKRLLVVLAGTALLTAVAPAAAQFFPFDDRYPFRRPYYQQEERPVDYSHAPAPKKVEIPPSLKILMLGDSMADWLAYGLEDALTETPEIGIVRKHRTFSGLIRYEPRAETEWAQVARDLIATEKPQAIVMMIGVQDRQAIRERTPPPAKPGAAQPAKPGAPQQAQQQQAGRDPRPDQDAEQPTIAGPELQRGRASGQHEYRSERWQELYEKKIDETIAVLKAANVPVLWVGLPSIRGARSTGDASYLNEIYRARADKAGIIFVDVWDGFVDERGVFVTQGPDYEGQIRRLRTNDGVHFTRFGARKLAHYVERDLRRVLTQPVPVALTPPAGAQPGVRTVTPSQPPPQPAPAAKPGSPAAPAMPAARPLAGPVVLLASPPTETDDLLGAPNTKPNVDAVASRVLVKGETLPAAVGRADDFTWPPRAPNTNVTEPLPPTTPPILALRPAQKTAQAGQPGPGGARVAGQPVLQGQIQPQRPSPSPFWRNQPPSYGNRGGFFGGLFGRF